MGKKHKHPEHENLERWLVSYADFITLLFATFVVLYALGQLDLAKFKELKSSLSAAFSGGSRGIMDKTNGMLDGQKDAGVLKNSGNSIMDKMSHKNTGEGQGQGTLAPVKDLVTKVNKEIKKKNQQIAEENKKLKNKEDKKHKGKSDKQQQAKQIPMAQMLVEERGIIIRFSSSMFFDPGTATLKPGALKTLDMVSESLAESGRVIQIEGHTDSDPIFSSQFPSNWELSSSRASSVVRYLINKHKFPKNKLVAAGYGDSRPVAPNSSFEGKAKNRRVDIVILFSKENPGKLQGDQLTDSTKQKPSSEDSHSSTSTKVEQEDVKETTHHNDTAEEPKKVSHTKSSPTSSKKEEKPVAGEYRIKFSKKKDDEESSSSGH